MSTSFTIWHYLDFILITSLLAIAIVYTLKQKDLRQKGSFIAIYSVVSLILLIFTVIGINGYTKQVLLVNLEDHRFLSTESIIYTGAVRNVGNYDVGEVEIEIEIFNKGLDKESKLFQKPTAFKDYYNDADIRKVFGFNDPENKPNSYTVRKTVAKELKAGQRKQFALSISYPSHFSGYTSKEQIIVH